MTTLSCFVFWIINRDGVDTEEHFVSLFKMRNRVCILGTYESHVQASNFLRQEADRKIPINEPHLSPIKVTKNYNQC